MQLGMANAADGARLTKALVDPLDTALPHHQPIRPIEGVVPPDEVVH